MIEVGKVGLEIGESLGLDLERIIQTILYITGISQNSIQTDQYRIFTCDRI